MNWKILHECVRYEERGPSANAEAGHVVAHRLPCLSLQVASQWHDDRRRPESFDSYLVSWSHTDIEGPLKRHPIVIDKAEGQRDHRFPAHAGQVVPHFEG